PHALHREDTVGEAAALLNAAIRLAPGDTSLFDRRALAHALSGNEAAAERDWARAAQLDPGSIAPTISPRLAGASARPAERGSGAFRTGGTRQLQRALGFDRAGRREGQAGRRGAGNCGAGTGAGSETASARPRVFGRSLVGAR